MTRLGEFRVNETIFQKSSSPSFQFHNFLTSYKFSKILIKQLLSYECKQDGRTEGRRDKGKFIGPFCFKTEDQKKKREYTHK